MADGVLKLQDVRVIDERIEELEDTVSITLTASGWQGSSAPYSQTVNNAKIKESSNPKLFSNIPTSFTQEQQQTYIEAYSKVTQGNGVTANGSVTFYVYEKPVIDITVKLKGV